MVEKADLLAQGCSEVGLSDIACQPEGDVCKERRVYVSEAKPGYADVDKVKTSKCKLGAGGASRQLIITRSC